MSSKLNLVHLADALSELGVPVPTVPTRPATPLDANAPDNPVFLGDTSPAATAGSVGHNEPAQPDEPNEPAAAPQGFAGFLRCASCNAVMNLLTTIAVSPPAPAGAIASGSREPTLTRRWYAVIVGRQVGVFYTNWERDIKPLTDGVPGGYYLVFATEQQARSRFEDALAAEKVHVHVD